MRRSENVYRIYVALLKMAELDGKYELTGSPSEKSLIFKETKGEWSKKLWISKHNSNKYKISGYEGNNNFIKTFEVELMYYKEVLDYVFKILKV